MIRVNGCWLETYFSLIGWGYDVDDHPLSKLNMVNETSRAILVEDYLLPVFRNLSPRQQHLVKETLKYAVNFFTDDDWEAFTQDQLSDITDNPREMFTDIWRMLFQGEPWLIENGADYFRNDDESDRLYLDKYKFGRI